MSARQNALRFVLPCWKCGAKSGDPCMNRDGSEAKRSHFARTPVGPCGTYAAYQRHKRNGEDACEPCLEASRVYHDKYRSERPEVWDKDVEALRAHRRATKRLKEKHADEFRKLLQEEKATA